MKRKPRRGPSRSTPERRAPTARIGPMLCFALALGAVAWAASVWWRKPGAPAVKAPANPTYRRDIAPLLREHCSICHRPGQAAPFPLLHYADARRHARDIRDAVASRVMPPWLPDPADGPFVGQRSLSAQQIAIITRWVDQGSPEGAAAESVVSPLVEQEWQLGKPDLVVQMPQPYQLPADGPDTYRNFVIPIPSSEGRWVKGVELRPGNSRVVHHAFLRLDPTRESRRRDEQEAGLGFGGLHTPVTAQTPPGQFLSWQPGKVHTPAPRGLAWKLERDSDLVLQMHLRPSGKPETIQPSIGFFFTDEAPTNTPFKIGLRHFAIDIPAQAADHVVRQAYTLAADVDLLSVLPHAHYLGKRLEAVATLPDGRQQPLLRIGQWDFNWQGEYLFQKPVPLPRGTTLSMTWHYDNSTNNARNPNLPPRAVRYGLQSSDEMAETWFQVLPRDAEGLAALARYDQPRAFQEAIAYNEYLLGLNPKDARAHQEIGKARLFLGEYAVAETTLRHAAALDPLYDEPRYFLGLLYRMQNKLPEAATELAAAVRLNPEHAKANGNLGLVLLDQGAIDMAEKYLLAALQLNPQDEIAKGALKQIEEKRKR